MNVTEAVMRRKSVRAFLPTPVDDDVVAELLTKASRAPSGGNVQPWRIYVVNGEAMVRFPRPALEPGYESSRNVRNR
jgi:nitroreductase